MEKDKTATNQLNNKIKMMEVGRAHTEKAWHVELFFS
jgi:hypothetical protein